MQGVAGQDAVGLPVAGGEPAWAGEAPPVGDGGDGVAGRVGGDQVVVGVVEPDPAQVFGRGGVQVPPEGELDGADGDRHGGGDVGDGDVGVGVLVDERHGSAQ